MLCVLLTEGALFAYLLFSYGYMASQYGKAWSPEPHPSLSLSLPNTAILLSSSVAVWWGEQGLKAGRGDQQLGGLITELDDMAMSGGVDSAVAAHLCAQGPGDAGKGCPSQADKGAPHLGAGGVIAVTLELWADHENDAESSCCSGPSRAIR